tara:strand:+ start:7549 stop:7773 length:225 start_codon:yes stop_codon:yes gene_type:complete
MCERSQEARARPTPAALKHKFHRARTARQAISNAFRGKLRSPLFKLRDNSQNAALKASKNSSQLAQYSSSIEDK